MAAERQYEHFMKHGLLSSVQPPSKILKEFVKNHANWSEKDLEELAKTCLLDISDVKMWLQNLNNGKKRKSKLFHCIFQSFY